MNPHNCPHCQEMKSKLQQHERNIAQLVDILAKTNEKLTDLEKRQFALSQRVPSYSVVN
jgi:glutaredoxin